MSKEIRTYVFEIEDAYIQEVGLNCVIVYDVEYAGERRSFHHDTMHNDTIELCERLRRQERHNEIQDVLEEDMPWDVERQIINWIEEINDRHEN